jgi:hypothetical protein
MMEIFLFAPNEVGWQLKSLLDKAIVDLPIRTFPAMKAGLDTLLRSSIYSSALESRIVILVASNRGDLDDFLQVRDLLEGIRLILILPDREKETLTKGLELRPRFFTHADGDLSWVVAVVQKMARVAQPQCLS